MNLVRTRSGIVRRYPFAPGSCLFLLALIAFGVSGTFAFADAAVPVTRSMCAGVEGHCRHRFVVEDVIAHTRELRRRPGERRRLFVERDLALGRTSARKRDLLEVDASGSIDGLWTRISRPVGGLPARHETTVSLHPDGAVRELTLGESVGLDGRFYATGTRLTFDPAGAVLADDMYPAIEAARRSGRTDVFAPTLLEIETEVAGIRVPAGSIIARDHGRISGIGLSRTVRYAGFRLRPAWLELQSSGRDARPRLAEALLAPGQRYRGVVLDDGKVRFHPSGRFAGATLATDGKVDGWPLRGERAFDVHESGALLQGTLAEDVTHDGIAVRAGTRIALRADGTLKVIHAQGTTTVGTLSFSSYGLAFHRDGRVARGVLAADASIDTVDFPARTLLTFDADGHVVDRMLPLPLPREEEPAFDGPVILHGGEAIGIEMPCDGAGVDGGRPTFGSTLAASQAGSPTLCR